jgi:FdhD protein
MKSRALSRRTQRRRVVRLTLPSEGQRGDGQQDGNEAAGPSGGVAAAVRADARADLLATEEPLGIRVAGEALAMTMRTPGDDIELAAGFLVSEAVARTRADIAEIKLCDGTSCGHVNHDDGELGNIADVTLAAGVGVPTGARRSFMTTSACGVCGKTSISDICVLPHAPLASDVTRFDPAVLAALPGRLRDAQRVFARTGGLHAAGLFTAAGDLIAIREDVGRHNAVDKIVGWALLNDRLPLSGCVLLVSGRASFELVQKAVLAGIPLLAAVSAPSSLAADLAEEAGLTLVGFLRGQTMNVYAGMHRLPDAYLRACRR